MAAVSPRIVSTHPSYPHYFLRKTARHSGFTPSRGFGLRVFSLQDIVHCFHTANRCLHRLRDRNAPRKPSVSTLGIQSRMTRKRRNIGKSFGRYDSKDGSELPAFRTAATHDCRQNSTIGMMLARRLHEWCHFLLEVCHRLYKRYHPRTIPTQSSGP